jgi:hypothetical protein
MSIDETRREAIINKLKELEEFLEPEGAHFVLHLFTSADVTEESYSIYNNRARRRHDRTIEGFKGRTKRRRQQEKFI